MSTATQPPTGTTDEQREAARLYLERRRTFRVHATASALSMVVVVTVNAMINAAAGITGDWWAWWSALVVICWGLAIAVHGLTVWASHPRRASAREEQQIDKILASGR